MMYLIQKVQHLIQEAKDRGASAVEYGLMVAAIAAVIVGIVFGLGGVVQEVFATTCDSIASGASTTCPP